MTTYASKDLYGGAITVKLPQGYIDTSDLRQVPDHQEIFLSPTALTSVIFEINEYTDKGSDSAAVHFHFEDVIEDEDRVAQELAKPTEVKMASKSMGKFPAYMLYGGIVTTELDQQAASSLPIEWQQSPQTKELRTMVIQLVARMKDYDTDLCIRINVPMKEMLSQEDADKAESAAKETMAKIVETLEVTDFGLFGAE